MEVGAEEIKFDFKNLKPRYLNGTQKFFLQNLL